MWPHATDWLIWQLVDSSLPTGGFAHSGGLEAAVQQGEIPDLRALRGFIEQALWQAGHGALPLVGAAHESPAALPELDALCDAFLISPVSKRASRLQGRALLSTCDRSLPVRALGALRESVRAGGLHQHHAPLFGAVLATLAVDHDCTQRVFLHVTLRGILSAAVRLGRLGPYQAQAMQYDLAPVLDAVIAHCGTLPVQELSQSAPLIDLWQSAHDRLYSRLFQS